MPDHKFPYETGRLMSNQIQRSFVIPVLDFSPHSPFNIRTLLEDLNSIRGEVICIFNSRDVYDELKDHPRIDKFCFNNMNAGVSRSWNIGINMSEGKTVHIMNADLHIGNSIADELDSYLFSLENAVIVGPQGSIIDYRLLSDLTYFSKGTFQRPISCDGISGFYFAIHLERFLNNQLSFDIQYSPCFFEEWDMGLQLKRKGLACYAVPVTDFDHHWGVSQSDSDKMINYFGKEMSRDDILLQNRVKFVKKWQAVVSTGDPMAEKKSEESAEEGNKQIHSYAGIKNPGVDRLLAFISKYQDQSYPEKTGEGTRDITNQVLTYFFSKYSLPAEARILDVGCGQGAALDAFRHMGYQAVGITLSNEDIRVCKALGHDVVRMDQSFLEFPDTVFDFVWVRHCLEHSIFPYFTLSEFFRIMKDGAYLYLEVPAANTKNRHELNVNHYSILTKEMWSVLIGRTGFEMLEDINMLVETTRGQDEYWAFICKKIDN